MSKRNFRTSILSIVSSKKVEETMAWLNQKHAPQKTKKNPSSPEKLFIEKNKNNDLDNLIDCAAAHNPGASRARF